METRVDSLSRATGIFSDISEGVVRGGAGGVCTCLADSCGSFKAETGTAAVDMVDGVVAAATAGGVAVAVVEVWLSDTKKGCPDDVAVTG